jgi:hypothetical protein
MTHPMNVPVLPLPDSVSSYLAARAAEDVDRALSTFTPSAEVTDDGRTYSGTAAIRTFLTTAGAQFEYTSTLVGVERLDDEVWIAHHRIEGNFPGGVADLAYRFELSGGLIARLDITA